MKDMRELVDKLNYYTKLYDEGNPAISDKAWDDMYFELQKMEEQTGIVLGDSPTVHVDYQVVNELKKVKHNHPMLSLDKTKDKNEIALFLGSRNGIAMAKMDGLTCSLRYLDGVLVSAETRGNGEIGEDILQNIVRVKGVPIEIPMQDELIVDGEVICTYTDFESFSDIYKNPRNFASGSIRLLDSRASAQRKLSFVAWDCISGLNCETLSEKLIKLDDLGFITVPYLVLPNNNSDTINYSIESIKNFAKELSYPIDGIVFKYDNCAYYQSLGMTEHHARGGLAFKFYDETYPTRLKDIEWSMGRTGVLTPVAVFDPIDIDGATVERASLHNISILRSLLGDTPWRGQPIEVYKANMIIPQIATAEISNMADWTYDRGFILKRPEKCPICNSVLVATRSDSDILNLTCLNPNCEGKFINKLEHFCGKKGLDIKGLSEATLQKLVDWGWVGNYQELFSLANFRDEWVEQPGFGPKSVDKLLATIEAARNCELWQFISALSIPLIGSTYAKQIAKNEFDWHNIREDIEGGYDFSEWNGFGYEMNSSLHDFDYTEADILASKILHLVNNLYEDPTKASEKPLANKKFVITGSLRQFKNRGELQSLIEDKGGKVVSSVSKNTDYLINNDINSTSAKNVAAKKLNIPIITEVDFMELFD